jgi:hypothetical protein
VYTTSGISVVNGTANTTNQDGVSVAVWQSAFGGFQTFSAESSFSVSLNDGMDTARLRVRVLVLTVSTQTVVWKLAPVFTGVEFLEQLFVREWRDIELLELSTAQLVRPSFTHTPKLNGLPHGNRSWRLHHHRQPS